MTDQEPQLPISPPEDRRRSFFDKLRSRRVAMGLAGLAIAAGGAGKAKASIDSAHSPQAVASAANRTSSTESHGTYRQLPFNTPVVLSAPPKHPFGLSKEWPGHDREQVWMIDAGRQALHTHADFLNVHITIPATQINQSKSSYIFYAPYDYNPVVKPEDNTSFLNYWLTGQGLTTTVSPSDVKNYSMQISYPNCVKIKDPHGKTEDWIQFTFDLSHYKYSDTEKVIEDDYQAHFDYYGWMKVSDLEKIPGVEINYYGKSQLGSAHMLHGKIGYDSFSKQSVVTLPNVPAAQIATADFYPKSATSSSAGITKVKDLQKFINSR